jgi:hypothetical protein
MPIPLTSNTCLAHHRGGYVTVRCCACSHERGIRVEALAPMVGWDTKLRNVLHRFRCSRCEAKSVELSFVYDQKLS